jgi:nucleotide-binding universal stress UspA family protein
MNIIIGYDGSDSARDAIHDLHRAGLPSDTRATIVSVADVWPLQAAAPISPADPAIVTWQQAPIARKARALVDATFADARATAADGAALLKAEFPRWTVADATYPGSPSEVLIVRAAAAEAAGAGAAGASPSAGGADLIVVGSQGRSALGRLVLGSVSQKVLMHAPCSVRIARRPPAGAAPRQGGVRILIGIDGSRHSALAVSAVAARVWPAGTQVKVVAAVDIKLLSVLASPVPSPWVRPWMDPAPQIDDARAWAHDAVEAVAAELRAVGLAATSLVEEADAKQLLVGEAERWSADCIFVGAKGQSAIERFLLGSVSASVAARAPCSVEVVRQG